MRASAAAVDRHHVVLAGLDVPGARSSRSACRGARRPRCGSRRSPRRRGTAPSRCASSSRELLRRDRLAEAHAGLGERRAGPRADRPPAVVVDGAVARASRSTGCGAWWARSASSSVCAKLTPWSGDCVTPRIVAGGSMSEQVEHGRHHVDDVRVLGAHLALGLDARRPGDDEGVAGAAAVGLALPAAERRVAGQRPAPRVVVEVLGAADLVDDLRGSPPAAPGRC